MYFIDTNVLIRAITKDEPKLVAKAIDFFEKLSQKEIVGLITDAVVAEAIYVLTSRIYEIHRSNAAAYLLPFLNLENVQAKHKTELVEAIKKYGDTNLDFVDCLALAYKEAGVVEKIFSFDKKLQ